jgi:hypothetical protein
MRLAAAVRRTKPFIVGVKLFDIPEKLPQKSGVWIGLPRCPYDTALW